MGFCINEQYSGRLGELITTREAFRPFPRYEDEPAWRALPKDVREYLLREGDRVLSEPVPEITASFFMNYSRTGERDYDEVFARRRQNMLLLALAECVGREGRYVDKLIDYIWALCEMTSWVLPAHSWNGLSGSWKNSGNVPLGDIRDFVLDLFSAQTGEYLAWALYIMRGPLDKVTYLIGERIEYELERRILLPFYNRRDFGWERDNLSNWHIWITSNCLAVVLLMEPNPRKRVLGAKLALRYTEDYIAEASDDGANGEGPMYWAVAAGSLHATLCLFSQATGGQLNLFENPKVGRLAAFLRDLHIARDEFYNYDYCSRFGTIYFGDEIYSFGRLVGDKALMGLGTRIYKLRAEPFQHHHQASLTLRELFAFPEFRTAELSPPYVGYCWYPSLQLMCAREHPGSIQGLFLGVKGNQGEFDRHLDGGGFILYLDGEPVFIDLGNATYNRSLISHETRFQHFMLQTVNHNAVTVDGFGQMIGRPGLSASSSTDQGGVATLSVDLSGSYDVQAGIKFLKREVSLDRNEGAILLRDRVECIKIADIRLSFMTSEPPVHTHGEFSVKGVCVEYDAALFAPETVELKHDDPVLRSSWGEHIYRTTLLARAAKLDSAVRITRQ